MNEDGQDVAGPSRNNVEQPAVATDGKETSPYWKMARHGMSLLLNNHQTEAEMYFKKYPDSIEMCTGYGTALFIDSLLTFEDDKLTLATTVLKDLEKRCLTSTTTTTSTSSTTTTSSSLLNTTSWLHSVRSRFQRHSITTSSISDLSPDERQERALLLAGYIRYLETQICLGDVQLYLSTLIFLGQDFSGYLRGGWMLRKAWKSYQRIHDEIAGLYRQIVAEGDDDALPERAKKPQTFKRSKGSTQINTPTTQTDSDSIASDSPYINDPTFDANTISEATESGTCPETSANPGSKACPGTTKDPDIPVVPVMSQCRRNGYLTSLSSSNSSGGMCKSQSAYTISKNSSVNDEIGSVNKHSSSVSGKNNGDNVSESMNNHSLSKMRKSLSINSSLSGKQGRLSKSLSFYSPLSQIASSLGFISGDNRFLLEIDKPTITRLMKAVSFGYGLLQLGMSLLPPSILKLTSIFGFQGDRGLGIANLTFAKTGTDMRAPMAILALLWYHTIVRPFFALDGNNVQAGVEVAARLIDDCKEEYGGSSMFLFFRGRVERLLSNIPSAINSFEASIAASSQREMKVVAMHEVGWCYMIRLDYNRSETTFHSLMLQSRWSRPFYAYLACICAGSAGKFTSTTVTSETQEQDSSEKSSHEDVKQATSSEEPEEVDPTRVDCDTEELSDGNSEFREDDCMETPIETSTVMDESSVRAVSCLSNQNQYNRLKYLDDMQSLFRSHQRGTPLDDYLRRRYRLCVATTTSHREDTKLFWELLLFEMIYLWNTLPSLTVNCITTIINVCNSVSLDNTYEPLVGLSLLLKGTCLCIRKDFPEAIVNFRQCIEARKDISHRAPDCHISAFSSYELGQQLLKHTNTRNEGKALLQSVLSYKDYDFEQRLVVRVASILKSL